MSVFYQLFGTLPFACDVKFPATHATSHAPESDLSCKASSVRAFQLKSIRGSRSFSDNGRDNQ